MAQLLRALALTVEDFGLIASIYMVVHSHLKLQVQGIEHPLLARVPHTHGALMYTNSHEIKVNK